MKFKIKCLIIILFSLHFAIAALDKTWWRHMQVYELLLSSFKDSDGDGIGDLNGLTSKLDHFVDLGINVIYLAPHYPSPMTDFGYDIQNFTDVNPMFGTLQDFDNLMAETKAKGIKVVLDMVINHSSDQHPWFIKSINREHPYTDYYVWKDPKGYDNNGKPIPPNNWVSIFEGSVWEWNENRRQFYLHQCAVQQPDLNYRNKLVVTEIKKIFKFWLDKKVAGFRLDAIQRLFEDAEFRDEPPISSNIKTPRKFDEFKHIYTIDQPETYETIRNLREFSNKVTRKFGDYERVLMGELLTEGEAYQKYYKVNGRRVLHFPLNAALNILNSYNNASFYHDLITKSLDVIPKGETPNWNSDNHDQYRKGLKFSEEYEYMYLAMIMFLPGVAYHYYGEEIGMPGCRIRKEQHRDTHEDTITHLLRDPGRLPMQWDDSLNAGFSNNYITYLPVCSNYWRVNVEKQKNEENSRYNIFKKITQLRKSATLKHGDVKLYTVSTWVFAFTRSLENHETYLVISNMGSETQLCDLHISIDGLPQVMKVEVASPNSGYTAGDKVPTHPGMKNVLVLRPSSTIVLSGMHL